MNLTPAPPTIAEVQYGVAVQYPDTPDQAPEIIRATSRLDAEAQAARIGGVAQRRAVPVERTPEDWIDYNGISLPDLLPGETLQWGVFRTWVDSHVEVEPSRSRNYAETSVRLAQVLVEPATSLVLRVLPAWRKVGTP